MDLSRKSLFVTLVVILIILSILTCKKKTEGFAAQYEVDGSFEFGGNTYTTQFIHNPRVGPHTHSTGGVTEEQLIATHEANMNPSPTPSSTEYQPHYKNQIIEPPAEPPAEPPTGSETESTNPELEEYFRTMNMEMMRITGLLAAGYLDQSNRTEIERKLKAIENIIKLLERNQRSADNHSSQIEFLRQLVLQSYQQLNLATNTIANMRVPNTGAQQVAQSHTHNNFDKKFDKPKLPNISQFKPTGPSNIFSPVIDISTGANDANNNYTDAYKKGYEEGIDEAKKLGIGPNGMTINYDKSRDKNLILQNQKSTSNITAIGEDVDINSGASGKGDNMDQAGLIDDSNNGANGEGESGYIKPDNKDKLGIPGYSYLDPKLWNVPQERTPVCIKSRELQRKPSALEPAGFVFGGPSNVMEFHGVGSIMPKFEYKEEVDSVEGDPIL